MQHDTTSLRCVSAAAKGRIFLAAALLAAALTGCLAGGGSEDEFVAEEEFAISSLDPAEGTFIQLNAINSYCDAETNFTDTAYPGWRYRIQDGRLLAWNHGDCFAEISATGTSTSIAGTWVSKTYGTPDSVPAEFRPRHCPDPTEYWRGWVMYPDEAEVYQAMFRNVTATYEISDSTIRTRLVGEPCLAEVSILPPGAYHPFITATSGHCTRVDLHNSRTGKKARVTSRMNGAGSVVTFSVGTTRCVQESVPPPTGATACEIESQQDAEREAFLACLNESGYFDTTSSP